MDTNRKSDNENFNIQCGIFYLTTQRNIMLSCALCENVYKQFQKYILHIAAEHVPQLKVEEMTVNDDLEYQNVTSDDDDLEDTNSFSDFQYGNVCLTMQGNIIFNCKICESNFYQFEQISDHITTKHIPLDGHIKEMIITNDNKDSQYTAMENDDDLEHVEECSERNNLKEITTECAEELHSSNEKFRTQADNGKMKPSNPENSRWPASKNDQDLRKLKCNICDFTCKNQKNLIPHMNRHSGIKSHLCTACPKSFYTKSELTMHFRRHTGERPFLCPECGKNFATSSKLGDHIKRHKNERNKVCTLCGMAFVTMQTLKRHLTTHSNDGNYECDVCSTRFKRRTSLTSHHKIHNNKLEYKCKLCSAGFNQNSGLWMHMKKKHNVVS